MHFEQVKFRTYIGEPDAELGGIAVYKYDNLEGVICGLCGRWHPAKEVKILKQYRDWVDLSDIIVEFNEVELDDSWFKDENE